MAPFRGSFISWLTFCTDPPPPIFRIAAKRKRNRVEISNSQNFLVSMISTSILNKKKIHDIGCTPLFELGWNDPTVTYSWYTWNQDICQIKMPKCNTLIWLNAKSIWFHVDSIQLQQKPFMPAGTAPSKCKYFF